MPRKKPYQRTILIRVQENMNGQQCGKSVHVDEDKSQTIIDVCEPHCVSAFAVKMREDLVRLTETS